jgi:hypothetical protein
MGLGKRDKDFLGGKETVLISCSELKLPLQFQVTARPYAVITASTYVVIYLDNSRFSRYAKRFLQSLWPDLQWNVFFNGSFGKYCW